MRATELELDSLRELKIFVPVLLFALLGVCVPALGSATRDFRPQADTLGVKVNPSVQSPATTVALGWQGAALRTNLFYAGTATPNLGIDFALGQHASLGVTAGLKPWPRWLAWDYATEDATKWRHFLVAPEFRWWPKRVFDGWFLGADLLYAHYNLGAIKLPFGLYSVLNEHRLQGDAYGAGLFFGHSWWLGEHWRLELAGGAAAAWIKADRYECPHCGAQVGTEQGVVVLPQLALNIAWDTRRRSGKRQQILDTIQRIEAEEVIKEEIPDQVGDDISQVRDDEEEIIPAEPEPVVEEEPTPEPQPIPEPPTTRRNPLLRPAAEYQPYTPDMVLRRSEGAQRVLFQFNDSRVLREVETLTGVYDNMPHLNTILDVTREALADESIVPVKIQIIGFASIDGGRWGNERLALERATAVKDYIRSKITSLPNDLFELVVGGEAWAEFIDELDDRQAAGTSGLTDDEYRQVAHILDVLQDLDEREKYLKALAGGTIYAKLQQSFLFDQRSAVFVRIFYEEQDINK